MVFFVFIWPGIMAAIGGLSGYFGSRDRGNEGITDRENQLRMELFREQNFNPMAPYQRLAKGKMYASFMRAWGMDKILGENFIDAVSDPRNFPGTSKVGGAPYMDPEGAGFERTGSTMGDIMAGAAGAVSGGMTGARFEQQGEEEE